MALTIFSTSVATAAPWLCSIVSVRPTSVTLATATIQRSTANQPPACHSVQQVYTLTQHYWLYPSSTQNVWLIDWLVFKVASAIFQSIYGGAKVYDIVHICNIFKCVPRYDMFEYYVCASISLYFWNDSSSPCFQGHAVNSCLGQNVPSGSSTHPRGRNSSSVVPCV